MWAFDKEAVQQNPENKEALKQQLVKIDYMEAEAALKNSLAGKIGTGIESVTSIAGFDWRINIALLGGFAAKEVIVSTLGTAYSMGDLDSEDDKGLSNRLKNDPEWDILRALSLMIFVILYAPCFITVITMAKESSWKWAIFSVIYTTILAFIAATAVYQ